MAHPNFLQVLARLVKGQTALSLTPLLTILITNPQKGEKKFIHHSHVGTLCTLTHVPVALSYGYKEDYPTLRKSDLIRVEQGPCGRRGGGQSTKKIRLISSTFPITRFSCLLGNHLGIPNLTCPSLETVSQVCFGHLGGFTIITGKRVTDNSKTRCGQPRTLCVAGPCGTCYEDPQKHATGRL